jgi:hypothetical protein
MRAIVFRVGIPKIGAVTLMRNRFPSSLLFGIESITDFKISRMSESVFVGLMHE